MSDIVTYVMQPVTILRLVSWLCCLIAFSVLAANGTQTVPNSVSTEEGTFSVNNGDDISVYNCKTSPLGFTIAISVLGWLETSALLCSFFLDAASPLSFRTILLKFDLCFSTLWAFFFFVAFCWTTNQWTSGGASECFSVVVETGPGVFQVFPVSFSDMKGCSGGLSSFPDFCFSSANVQAAGTGISFSFFCWWLFTAIAAVVGFKIFNEDAGAKDDEAAFMGAADPDPISDTHQEVPYSAMDDDDTTVVARS